MADRIVHAEVVGRDAKKLQGFFSELFGWKFDTNNCRIKLNMAVFAPIPSANVITAIVVVAGLFSSIRKL